MKNLNENTIIKNYYLKQYPTDELAQLPKNIKLVSSHKITVPELVGERHVIVLKKV